MSGEAPLPKTSESSRPVDVSEDTKISKLVDLSEDAKIAKLVEMGFRVEEARETLHQCQGDVEAACELLATAPSASSSSSGGASGFLSSLVR